MAELTSAREVLDDESDVREVVRDAYARVAKGASGGGCCSGTDEVKLEDGTGTQVFGATNYEGSGETGCGSSAIESSLGCGVPTAVADLHEGETVLDLGSGAGADVLISARRVGASGKAIGLDMTDEMLELARRNAREEGIDNVEFVKGYIEEIPLPDASVDVVISNCVLNLSADKGKVFSEVVRVLKPGGRFAVSDVIADENMDEATRQDMQQWTGCIAGALTEAEFRRVMQDAGLAGISIDETHRVHEHAGSAIIRAIKPG